MKTEILLGILALLALIILGVFSFSYLSSRGESDSEDYYGQSRGSCQVSSDCVISGCNSEICAGRGEELPLVSICVKPDKPTPQELGYECECVDTKCQWTQ